MGGGHVDYLEVEKFVCTFAVEVSQCMFLLWHGESGRFSSSPISADFCDMGAQGWGRGGGGGACGLR